MAKKRKEMKPQGNIRRSQLITTFGPGSMMDLPDHSVLIAGLDHWKGCLLYTSPSPRDRQKSRMPSSA